MPDIPNLTFQFYFLYTENAVYFRLIKRNGEILLNSLPFNTINAARSAADSVKEHGKQGGTGDYVKRNRAFELIDPQNNLLGRSPDFFSDEICSEQIDYARLNLAEAQLEA